MLVNNLYDNISHVREHIVLIMQTQKNCLTRFYTKINCFIIVIDEL